MTTRYISPEFRVEKTTRASLELHYWCQRPGQGSWVEGICEAVAAEVYKTSVKFKLLRGRDDGSCDHEVGGEA